MSIFKDLFGYSMFLFTLVEDSNVTVDFSVSSGVSSWATKPIYHKYTWLFPPTWEPFFFKYHIEGKLFSPPLRILLSSEKGSQPTIREMREEKTIGCQWS
jgi:hypothetical protein